jgi:DnaJ-domain-containing protein 1
MDMQKYTEKVGEVLEWLKVNDAGALGPVIQATCEAGLTATTDEDRDKFWASIRSLCGTLPKSPIRRGIQSSLTAEQVAAVDSVVNRIESAFASIGEEELMLDVFFPRQRGDSMGPYGNIDAFASDMAAKVKRSIKKAITENRWDGLLDDNMLTGMVPPAPTESKKTEVPSEE